MNQEKKKLLKEWEIKQIMSNSSKFYQYKEKINGTEYVFQFPGFRKVMQITDDATIEGANGAEKRSRQILLEKMFETIVVSPAVNFDYFDEKPDDFERVVEICSEFMGSDFRNIGKKEK